MTTDDALREIARILQTDPAKPLKKLDRIYRVLVQAGAIAVPGVTTGTKAEKARQS